MAVTREQVAQIYVATFNRAPLSEGLDYWTSSDFTIEQVATSFFDQDEAQAIYTDGGVPISSEEFVLRIFDNLFNRLPLAAGLDYWTEALDNETVSQAEMILAVANGATDPDDVAILANKTEAGMYYADNGGERTDYYLDGIDETQASLDDVIADMDAELTPSEDGSFTADTDDLVGGAGNDTFEASIVQNPWAGGVSNSLSTADDLDGGAGSDSLYAELVPEFYGVTGDNIMDVQPSIQNVEDIRFEAMDVWSNNLDDEDNDDNGGVETDGVITVDAKNITDVDHIGSAYSDGDLVIENLTTLTSDGVARNTDTITITMDHTDNFNSDEDASDLTVYFDEDYLLSGENYQSQAIYYLLDQDADMNDTDINGDGVVDLLAFINTNGLRFTVNGGAEQVISFDQQLLEDGEILNHDDFVEALQPALDALIASGDVPADTTLTVDYSMTRATFLDDGSVSSDIPAIVIESQSTTGLESVGFLWVEDLSGDFNVYGRLDEDDAVANNPVAINVELDKVGRDNEGGNLEIGGKHSEGIPDFYVKVLGTEDRPSNLGTITTNQDYLENIYISTHEDYVAGEDYASLTIRDGFENQASVDLVDADDFLGDLTLGSEIAVDDLITLRASGGGDVYFEGRIDTEEDYSYTTGSGEDFFDIELDTDAIDTINTGLSINTNAGDDVVILDGSGEGSQLTMAALDNVSISTGSGEDYVYVVNEVRVDIDAGSDSDFVEFAGGDQGEWAFGQATGPQAFGERVLYKATLTLTFAGFESTVNIDTNVSGNFIADQMTINAAIEAAIEANPELDRLLVVSEGDGYQQIFVDSMVGGENDLRVTINQPEVVADDAINDQVEIASSTMSALVQGLIDTTNLTSDDLEDADEIEAAMAGNNFGGAQFDGNVDADGVVGADYQAYDPGTVTVGTDGGAANYSVINMGTGSNDLLVLDSNDSSANVLEITSTFGKVSVVNFHDDSPNDVTDVAQVGNHALDFTTYLDNEIDPSATTNTQSKTPIAVTLNTNAQLVGSAANTGTAEANSVNMLNFNEDISTDSVAWDSITAANLVTALNEGADANDFGGIDQNTLDAVNSTANLISDVQDHIVMVENDLNPGEYKVFYLTSTVDPDDGTEGLFDTSSALMLGTLDFGNSINFQLVGSEEWDELIDTLLFTFDASTGNQDAIYTVAEAQAAADLVLLPDTYTIDDDAQAIADNVLDANDVVTDANEVNATTSALSLVDAAKLESLAGLNDDESAYTIADEAATIEAVAAAGWGNYPNATAIDSTDDTLELTQEKAVALFDTAEIAPTAADVVTVTAVTDAAGDFVETDTIDQLDDNDIITFDGNTATLNAENYKSVFETAGVAATAGDTITVDTLDDLSVTATAAADVFEILSDDAGVAIADFLSDDDTVALDGGSGAVAAEDVATGGGAETLILDTAANLGADGSSIGDRSIGSEVHWAVASDTGAIYYDADGDWTADVVLIGTVTADTLIAADFTI